MRSFAKFAAQFRIAAIAMMALLTVLVAAPAFAADPAPATPPAKTGLTVAVVDIQALLRDSKAAKSIETQLATIRKSFQTEVETEEKSLRAKEKEILDQKASLKEEELKAKAQDFQKQVAAGQKKIQDKKAKLDKGVGTAIGKLRAEIVKVVAEIGDKRNLDLVLARTDVVIVSKSLDITAEVLARIDSELPSVTVTVEK